MDFLSFLSCLFFVSWESAESLLPPDSVSAPEVAVSALSEEESLEPSAMAPTEAEFWFSGSMD